MRRMVWVIVAACGHPPAAPQHVVSNQAPRAHAAVEEASIDFTGTPEVCPDQVNIMPSSEFPRH